MLNALIVSFEGRLGDSCEALLAFDDASLLGSAAYSHYNVDREMVPHLPVWLAESSGKRDL